MANHPHKTSIRLISIVSFSIVAITLIISIFARGYKINLFNPNNKSIITATGILSATSKPKGASVYLNDKLTTATDDTLNLKPNSYQLKIVKDGYLPWQKTIQIKKETVYQTNTQLFRSVPDLSPITYTGAIDPIISPDNSKIVYVVASASAATDNGLFIIELNKNFPLSNRFTPRQLSPNLSNIDWSKFDFTFSPNSRQILATNSNKTISYLLPLDTSISSRNLQNINLTLETINKDWQEQSQQLITNKLDKVPEELKPFISTSSAQDIQFSDNQEKIFYLAQEDGDLTEEIITPLPAQSTQKQSRDIKIDNYYVYDLKDDTNFFIASKSDINQVSWLANSESLIFTSQQQIKVIDYDNTNQHTLFAGNFQANTVLPTLDGNKIVTLISPYQSAPENLYTISIR